MSSIIKAKNSLLLLTQTLADLKQNLKYLLEESFKYTNDNLYIYINPFQAKFQPPTTEQISLPPTGLNTLLTPTQINDRYQLKLIIKQFYQNSLKLNPNINVTCLLYNVHSPKLSSQILKKVELDYDLILTDLSTDASSYSELLQFCRTNAPNKKFDSELKIPYHSIVCESQDTSEYVDQAPMNYDQILANNVYENSILGGTFDRLHVGHKIMLSEAVLLTKNRLLIGVTGQSMLTRKKLAELIEDVDTRCNNVKQFLNLVAPGLEVLTVEISDAFGPSITERDYQCLIASQETYKTGDLINQKRVENNMPELAIHVIELIIEDDKVHSENEGDEDKISSSNQRRRLLGTLLRPPYKPYDPSKPYVIGLTGGLASGKTAIRNDLVKLGAVTIDCDKLGHRSYEKDTEAYKKIVETFGSEILDANHNIDRQKLGQKVFEKPEELKKLTDIVWPEIRKLLDKEIEILFSNGNKIIVVEAALLLDANWNSDMNEVWVSFVPSEEAIKRSIERDNSSIEKVKAILKSQMSNKDRIKQANVVFCSLWERAYTIKQVNKAWDLLLKRTIGQRSKI